MTRTAADLLAAQNGPVTFAELPLASAVSEGTKYFVTDVGSAGGATLVSNGTIWNPDNCEAMLYGQGTTGVSIASGLTTTSVAISQALTGWQDGQLVQLSGRCFKTGAVSGATIGVSFNNTSGTAGALITTATFSAANRNQTYFFAFQRINNTTVRTIQYGVDGTSASSSLFTDVTVPSIDAGLFVQLCGRVTGGTDGLIFYGTRIKLKA